MNAQIGNRAGIWIVYYWHLGDSVCGGSFGAFRILCWISWISALTMWISWISIISICSFSGFRTLMLVFVDFAF